jgi:hypothetical protein
MFGALSVFGRRIKGMITLQLEQVWMLDVECDTSPLPAAPVTNWEAWEPPGVTLAGYSYAKRQGMKVEIVTSYRVRH